MAENKELKSGGGAVHIVKPVEIDFWSVQRRVIENQVLALWEYQERG